MVLRSIKELQSNQYSRLLYDESVFTSYCKFLKVKIDNNFFVPPTKLELWLKAHSQVWDNFWQLKALSKWWKILFISPQILFSLNFFLGFLFMQENGLIWNIRLISTFITSQSRKQTIAMHILPNIYDNLTK